jgi:hypothetical protein
MVGCPVCKTTMTIKISKRKVCYFCGGPLSDFEVVPDAPDTHQDLMQELDLGDEVGEPIVGDVITIINDDCYDYDD